MSDTKLSYVANRSRMSSIDGLLSRAVSDIFPSGCIPDLFQLLPVGANPTRWCYQSYVDGTVVLFGPDTHSRATNRFLQVGRTASGVTMLERQQNDNAAYWEQRNRDSFGTN